MPLDEELMVEVTEPDAGQRIDTFLAGRFPEYSRSFLKKLLDEGNIELLEPADGSRKEGKALKSSYKVKNGDRILLRIPEPEELSVEPEDIPLSILYEDDSLLVIDKPKGMVVHPAAGHYSGTLVNAVLFHCRGQLSGINGILRPGIVHRIDKDTTGALVVCKTDAAHKKLAEQLKEHSSHRRYRAIVYGNIKEDEGTVNAPVGRHPTDRKKMAVNVKNGKEAVTHYRVLERFGDYTYIECALETGRTHQIRVHMTSIGHPLLGDEVYGSGRNPFHLQGQTLHAMELGFAHPVTGEYMEFTAPLPDYFEDLLCKLRK